MGKNARHDPRDEAAAIGFDSLRKALILVGAVIPTTAEDVVFLERAGQEQIPLPEHLRDPFQVLAQACSLPKQPKKQMQSPTTVVELARAAREGGEISPEIEARMKAAREQAERDDSDNSKG